MASTLSPAAIRYFRFQEKYLAMKISGMSITPFLCGLGNGLGESYGSTTPSPWPTAEPSTRLCFARGHEAFSISDSADS